MFEERIEETIVHHDTEEELPKQRPDRMIGLRETNNIRQLLNQPPRGLPDTNEQKLRDLVRCAPFKWQSSPLLFPFLVLEAKSDSTPASFSDIQTQTSFPIWSLLNLQRDLRLQRPVVSGAPEALVWFLGYRGNDWKIYGCYVSTNPESECTYVSYLTVGLPHQVFEDSYQILIGKRQNIHYLQSGDITTKDGALQLLLLLDYIVDWARDTLRPAIIAQLRSLAMGRDFDEISRGPESDIISKERTIRDWVSRIPSTVAQDETAHMPTNNSTELRFHGDLVSVSPPDTEFGIVRPVSAATLQLSGLRLTEGNVESLLALSDGPEHGKSYSACARKLVNELTRWDETLVVLGADLDDIERVWADDQKMALEPFDEGSGAEFYAVLEYRCFMTVAWEIVREISYWAISKSAFAVLCKHAKFQKKHSRIDSFPERLRPCSGTRVEDTVACLRSGSSWQVLLSALSSTLLTFYPEPARKRGESSTFVESLGFGCPGAIRVRYFVGDYLKKTAGLARRRKKAGPGSPEAKKHKSLDAWEQKTSNRSFRRISKRAVGFVEAAHDPADCTRCSRGKQDLFMLKHWNKEDIPLPTAYGAILAASLQEEYADASSHQQRHDLSLFVLEYSPWLEDQMSISTIVEDLAQDTSIYHTIRHEPSAGIAGVQAVLWNLPRPYRRTTRRQRLDIQRWTRELNG